MVYFANSQHILFLLELTFCTTILVHHVLPYVVVPQECPVRDRWDLFEWEPMSCLYLATFCHTWTFRIVICEARIRFIKKGSCLRLDVVHAVA
jgi:hypothetical protein